MALVVALAVLTFPGASLAAADPPAAPLAAPPAPPALAARDLTLFEALQLTLLSDPAIELAAADRQAAEGSLWVAQGQFDPLLRSDLTADEDRLPGAGGQSSRSESLTTAADVSYQLRSGLLLQPSASVTRTEVDGGGAVSQGRVAFGLRQPLLRDRGRAVVGAAEDAARLELASATRDLRHRVTQRLLVVINAYWSWKAAAENLEVIRASEASSRELLATTRRLIEADLTPAAEIVQLEADLAFKRSSRIAAEQALFSARQDLGREIGLTAGRIPRLGRAVEPFPDLVPEPASGPAADHDSGPGADHGSGLESEPVEPLPSDLEAEVAGLLALAFDRRADLAAAGDRLAAARLRAHAAANGLLPVLDLVAVPSYAGRAEGGDSEDLFTPLWSNIPGLSATLGLAFSFPVGNREAEGRLRLAEAARRRRELDIDLLRRQIGADVPTAYDAVLGSARRLRQEVAAVELYTEVVGNEDRKLKAGRSTLIDVISQRDRLTAARQRRVAAQRSLALALAQLRFETGTLLRREPAAASPETGELSLSGPESSVWSLDAQAPLTLPSQPQTQLQPLEPSIPGLPPPSLSPTLPMETP